IRTPPAAVPSAIAAAHAMITQYGTVPSCAGMTQAGVHSGRAWPAAAYETSARVMIPIDFCASFDPCENAIRLAETSWRRRDPRCTVPGASGRTIHSSVIIVADARKNPMVGDSASGIRTLLTSVDHWIAPTPA